MNKPKMGMAKAGFVVSIDQGKPGNTFTDNKNSDKNIANQELFDNLISQTHLLTAQQVGKILNISPKTVFAWAKVHKIPCVRLGVNTVRFRPCDIAEIIDSSRTFKGDRK